MQSRYNRETKKAPDGQNQRLEILSARQLINNKGYDNKYTKSHH